MSIISLNNLTKGYGENIILDNVSLEVNPGDVISIIGPSGTGKSTLLRAINYLDPPTEGKVFFKNIEINKQTMDAIRCKMNMVFQNFGLFTHLTVLENLTLGQRQLLKTPKIQATEKALEILKTVGLTERANYYPDQLSGGQKQRVAIARCLAMSPEVILFDEPTSALDPTMVSEVMSVMRNLAKTGITMLVVTHEMDFAQDVSNRVLYIDEKGIYEQGTPEEIFKAPKKPKTKKFIYNIRSFNYGVRSKNFDFVEMLSGVENFCFRNAIEKKTANKLQLLAEEIIINLIMPLYNECDLNLNYSEKLASYEMTIAYPGQKNNLLEGAEDDLSLMIIKNTAQTINYEYRGSENLLKLEL